MVPRIYVDFNDFGPHIGLGFNGTLRDLSIQRIRLTHGMPLVLYDDDGDESMEVDAVVEYHPNAAFGPQMQWRARVDKSSFRRRPRTTGPISTFAIPCFRCGDDIYKQALDRKITDLDFKCEKCGGRVLEPFLPRSVL